MGSRKDEKSKVKFWRSSNLPISEVGVEKESTDDLYSSYRDFRRVTTSKSRLFSIFFDGKPLSDFSKYTTEGWDATAVDIFFRQGLLAKFVIDRKEQYIERAITYLKSSFHQGGFLCPVSAALNINILKVTSTICLANNLILKQLYLKPTKNGFIVQEILNIRGVLVSSRDGVAGKLLEDDKRSINDYTLLFSPDDKFSVEGTIEVDFSNDGNPTLRVTSCNMDLNIPELRVYLDDRSFWQIIVDYLRNLFGFEQVEYIGKDEVEGDDDLPRHSLGNTTD